MLRRPPLGPSSIHRSVVVVPPPLQHELVAAADYSPAAVLPLLQHELVATHGTGMAAGPMLTLIRAALLATDSRQPSGST